MAPFFEGVWPWIFVPAVCLAALIGLDPYLRRVLRRDYLPLQRDLDSRLESLESA